MKFVETSPGVFERVDTLGNVCPHKCKNRDIKCHQCHEYSEFEHSEYRTVTPYTEALRKISLKPKVILKEVPVEALPFISSKGRTDLDGYSSGWGF